MGCVLYPWIVFCYTFQLKARQRQILCWQNPRCMCESVQCLTPHCVIQFWIFGKCHVVTLRCASQCGALSWPMGSRTLCSVSQRRRRVSRLHAVQHSAESIISRISPRKQNCLQNHFCLTIRGSEGFD